MITYAPRDHKTAIMARRQRLQRENQQKRRRLRTTLVILIVILALIGSGTGLIFTAGNSIKLTATNEHFDVQAKTTSVNWPTDGQAAVGLQSSGVIATSAEQKPAPTASVAKVMTALMILRKHPLKTGEQGPNVPITQADVDSYYEYSAKDGSTVPVTVGETITEYQALQAILLPSANNMADTTAIWAYGSIENYLKAANEYAKSIGMLSTTFATDASGFSPNTTSTPRDLILLGGKALGNPVLKEIVAQKSAEIPVAGTINNVNSLLEVNGMIGIKTGNTAEAGGCFLFAARRTVNGVEAELIGAIMNSPNLDQAMQDSLSLLDSFGSGFTTTAVVKEGEQVGSYELPWGGSIAVRSEKAVNVVGWGGSNAAVSVKTKTLKPGQKPSDTGELTASSALQKQTTKLKLDRAVPPAPFSWKLRSLFNRF
jgi:D-alanyl-D-alanine carboxypeptidase (penicillin-binding protein 5/6)